MNKEYLSDHARVEIDDFGSVLAKSFVEKVAEYIENQVKNFLKDNKISEKRWMKYGVIQQLPPEIGIQSYIIYYKFCKKELKRKITIQYSDFIIGV